MAVSVNGMIATPSGSEEFLSHENWLEFVKLTKRVGCFIWGRKTYENVITWDKSYLKQLENVKKVIISTSKLDLQKGFVQAKSINEALYLLNDWGFKEAIVTGGSITNRNFALKKLITEVILYINPSILGLGIPVFNPADFVLKLKLTSVKKISENIIEVRYNVLENTTVTKINL